MTTAEEASQKLEEVATTQTYVLLHIRNNIGTRATNYVSMSDDCRPRVIYFYGQFLLHQVHKDK